MEIKITYSNVLADVTDPKCGKQGDPRIYDGCLPTEEYRRLRRETIMFRLEELCAFDLKKFIENQRIDLLINLAVAEQEPSYEQVRAGAKPWEYEDYKSFKDKIRLLLFLGK